MDLGFYANVTGDYQFKCQVNVGVVQDSRMNLPASLPYDCAHAHCARRGTQIYTCKCSSKYVIEPVADT